MLKEKLQSAKEKSELVLERLVWKLSKKLDNSGRYVQDTIRLIDATDDQLNEFYQHCLTMLYNTDTKYPGREVLLRIINEQIDKCNAELFFRTHDEIGDRETLLVRPIEDLITNNNLSANDVSKMTLGDVVVSTSEEFSNIPLNIILDAGKNKLGLYDRTYMTLTFLLNKGLSLSDKERERYSEYDEDQIIFSVMNTLGLKNTAIPLKFNRVTGLSVEEFQYMLPLKKKRYSQIHTDILVLLRDHLLLMLKEDITYHINQWKERKSWIEQVQESRVSQAA